MRLLTDFFYNIARLQMTTKHSTFEVELSLGSALYLAAIFGLSGGAVLGVIGFLYSVVEGDWLSAVFSLLASPVVAMLSTVVYALAGFPIYRRLSRRTPTARQLHGVFQPASLENESSQSVGE